MKKRSDGRYVKVITDPKTHKRISFYGSTAREVNQKLLEYERKQENGRSFDEVADEWWSSVYEDLAHQTLRGYKPAYARVLSEFSSYYISDIQPRDILLFYKRMVAQQFTAKTIANHRVILNQIFNFAVVAGDIQYNPVSSVKIPKAATTPPRPPASATDEQKILESDHPWLFPLFALLTGLRKGEILALQWQDINLEANTISVTKSVEHIGKNPSIKAPKTANGTRVVPLLDLLKDKLVPLQSKPAHYIFSDDGGKSPLSEHRYTRLFRDYQRDVGIACTAHQLRHSYATPQ